MKLMNVLIQELEIGDTPLANAQSLFLLMEVNLTCDSAWRVGKGDESKRLLVIKFRTAADRSYLMSMSGALKGTKVYLQDDLTKIGRAHV